MREQQPKLPENWFHRAGRVFVLEGTAGRARRCWLEDGLEDARQQGARTWLLDCSFEHGGPWAGLRELFLSILPELQKERPDLVEKHDYELVHVVPELQESIKVRNPTLTDLAPPEEKVRNYPADRAFRIVHGLIDLLDRWKGESRTPWVLGCDRLDRASHIGRRFFRELLRRRGSQLRIVVLGGAEAGGGQALYEFLGEERAGCTLHAFLSGDPPEDIDRCLAAQRAAELDGRGDRDRIFAQAHLPEIIHYARLGCRPDLLFKWKFRGLEIYNTLGLYEDARSYGEDLRARLEDPSSPKPEAVRWALFLKLIMCHLGLGDAQAAGELAEEDYLDEIRQPEWRCQLCYLRAMLHARYLPVRDLDRAVDHLEEGVKALEGADMPEERIHFQYAFNRNGLAMVRHFQGRYEEAIALCRASQERLEAHLGQDRHRLHRSVLLYNLAQVCSVLGRSEEAIGHYSSAMAMDPNYSEYYNERGSILLRLGRLEEARADYRRAIELSPPYFESLTNLGQCARLLGHMEEAVDAYTRALDIEPGQLLALLGRAQACEALERWDDAREDYTAALQLKADQWEAFANRAAALFQLGRLQECLADLDQAIELSPPQPDLFYNRGFVHEALGDPGRALQDFRTCLTLGPEEGDAAVVASRLQLLEIEAATAA